MKLRSDCLLATGIFIAVIVLESTPVLAQSNEEKDASGLPTVRVVLDRYIQALGGYEMLESRRSLHFISKGTNTHGSTFTYEAYQVEGKFHSRFDFDDGRVIERGVRTDGGRTRTGNRTGVAWEISNGLLREMEGDEREEYLRRRSTVSGATALLTSYESIECHSVEFIGDKKVYKLLFVDFEGTEIERYYDAESGLLVRRVCIEEFGTRRERVVRDYQNYEQIGDFMVSKKQTVTQARGDRWIYEIDVYEVDIRVPRGTFDVPKTIAAALAKANMGQKVENEKK